MTTLTKMTTLTAALAAALALSACQSTPTSSPVIQRANATYETTGLGATKIEAQQNAINSANKTCRGKQVIVITDKTTFNGIINERTGRMIEQMGNVVGSVMGKSSPELSRDDDYEYTINFRCQ